MLKPVYLQLAKYFLGGKEMRNSVLIGMAMGALMGAVLVEGNSAVSRAISKGKNAVKSRVENLNALMK